MSIPIIVEHPEGGHEEPREVLVVMAHRVTDSKGTFWLLHSTEPLRASGKFCCGEGKPTPTAWKVAPMEPVLCLKMPW